MNNQQEIIACFSMEIALDPAMPTYSGGLGMLAGDTLRSAADLKLPILGVTLLHRKGYFTQRLDANGWQIEEPAEWPVEKLLHEEPARARVSVEGRTVHLRAWRYSIRGLNAHEVPVFLLDSDVPENSAYDRELTHYLYGGDTRYRLCQEVILGIGGVRMLRALGYSPYFAGRIAAQARGATTEEGTRCAEVVRFHMNEGHASLLGLELLDECAHSDLRSTFNQDDVQAVRRKCVFTTHTPVPAGHDKFSLDLVARTLGRSDFAVHHDVFCCEGELNMTYLALNLSHFVNGVARRHGEVSRQILVPHDAYHHYQIDYITNGVHLNTWVAPSFRELFDRHIPGWHEDNSGLRSVLKVPKDQVWHAHVAAKTRLIEETNRRARADFDTETLTIGFARRATAYKRPALLLTDPQRLRRIAAQAGRLQVIFAGKAHPHDEPGKHLIQEIVHARGTLRPEVRLVYLENYDWELARLLTGGADLWLNTPQPPLEASGTSGMKAALNGVPSLSVLDGWWLEGCIEDVTGWAVGEQCGAVSDAAERARCDAASLYEKLEQVVVPKYYRQRDDWLRIMRHAIALNASHFNTHRMVSQYVVKAYF